MDSSGSAHGMNYSIAPDEYEERLLKFFTQTLLSDRTLKSS